MGASRSVAKNTILLTIGLMSGRVLALFLQKKMAPILGPEGLGIWFAAIGLTAILQVVANFGLGTLLTREITRAREMTLPLFWAALRIRWMLGAFCYLFLLGYVSVQGWDPLARTAVLLTGLAIFIEATSMACDSVLQAHEKVEFQSLGQIVSAFVYFGLAWYWLDAGHGLLGVVWANLISRIGRLLVMAPLMFRKTGPWTRRAPDGESTPGMRWLMRLGFPLFLSTTFGIIYNYVDTVMLKEIVGDAAAGIYGLGHRALDVTIMLPSLFATALFPAMARYGLQSPRDAARLGERALRFLLAVVIPLTLFLSFTAGPIIRWFDDSRRFADSAPVLVIVIWGLPLQAANVIFNRLLITAGREKAFVMIGGVSMVANVAFNAVLIPRYSYFGASSATLVSLLVSFFLHVRYLSGSEYRPPLLRAVAGPLSAVLVAWTATVGLVKVAWPAWGIGWTGLPLDGGWTPFLGASAVMTVAYLAAVFALRVLRIGDLRLLQDLVRR